MSDRLVDIIRKENYIIEIFQHTKNAEYVKIAKEIIEFVKEIYRSIEPSHYNGKIIVFKDLKDSVLFEEDLQENFYDKGILSHDYDSLIFQLMSNDNLPLIWKNVTNDNILKLLDTADNFITYIFDGKKEYFIVNKQEIQILNKFSCPSIFALQYHYLDEALLDYKNIRVKTVSCEHFKKCLDDKNWIYFKNKPEECMQISLNEFLINRIRGIKIAIREYNLGASKPVDVRVYWREANRAALIELKWIGQSLNDSGGIGTSYSNGRANDGMHQIKEYIDLERGDTPSIITKGYLVVVDGRRRNISDNKVSSLSRDDGMYYAGKELNIKEELKYWETFPNIEKPIRMFVEPICEK
ncbi:MAG: hypothetical protein KAT68_09975 [Bacteroidales bacterium]|nr:hypothetical protein [Bacteroidales bacterium]